jgi:glutamyl/glutaminyl-tRNA synthetase
LFDDFDMGITHVIRGERPLKNDVPQLAIIRRWAAEPVYAHVP